MKTKKMKCDECNGSGKVACDCNGNNENCKFCHGTDMMICPVCEGTGVREVEDDL